MREGNRETPRVCLFGIYDPLYPRNRVLVQGFQGNGYEVVHCCVDPREHHGVTKFYFLIQRYFSIRKNTFDLVIVAFPGHTVVWLARFLFGHRIIFDAFVSIYNSNVEDRKRHSKFSLRGVWDWFLDWHSLRIASVVLFDTDTQIKYVAKKFRIPANKFRRVFVGTDDSVFRPRARTQKNDRFTIHFHGTFIPLHGIEYIIEAAKLIESDPSVVFEIIGDGQERRTIESKIAKMGSGKNLRLLPKMSYEELAQSVSGADVCLGIFGMTNKATMVIPNKVFETLASERALITMSSDAIKEIAVDGQNMILCHPGDPRDLADKILLLKQDFELRNRIAEQGYQLFTKEFTPTILVKHLISDL